MKNNKQRGVKLRLTILFTVINFCILLSTMIFGFIGIYLTNYFGAVGNNAVALAPILFFAIVSVVIGTIFSAMFMRRALNPFQKIIVASEKIAAGDYSARIDFQGPGIFRQLSSSFNHMAEEIGSAEMLRSDFVNNFSHEFKTPIVSIRGFAKMLKRADLTEEERNEYLDIIINESERLAELSTNVLNLSKLESQHILTDKKTINISEQIRLSVALLEKKWEKKKIDIQFDSDEVYMIGNEEMLRQVWINLIDNAIKFSPDYGSVKIAMQQGPEEMSVSFINEGGISEETAARVFDKFYQGDTSHAQQGNGLGLTIARKIVELHGGTLKLDNSNPGCTVFQAMFSL